VSLHRSTSRAARLVLGSGSMPLDVLDQVVDDWIAEQQ